MKSKIATLKKSFMTEVSATEAGQAVKHLIDVFKQIRSECAAMATYIVEIHSIDLRSLFLALHNVEEFGIDRPTPKPVYKRNESLQITGWSRTTLWRKCDEIGLPARKKAFTHSRKKTPTPIAINPRRIAYIYLQRGLVCPPHNRVKIQASGFYIFPTDLAASIQKKSGVECVSESVSKRKRPPMKWP